ncbi:MAG: isochorismatase family protein [Thermoleophilia bacterium]
MQDTPGAQLHPGLPGELVDVIMDKGLDPHSQGYSAFQDTGLAKLLRADRVQHLVVVGLATDYCVRNSVLDALREGFDVTVVRSGVRAVDLTPGDGERALQEMHAAGARLVADAADLVGDA